MSLTFYPASVKFNDSGTYKSVAAIGPEQRLSFTDVAVSSSAFASNSTYADYPYAASIALAGVSSSMIPEIIFNLSDMNGTFAPMCSTYDGGVNIYSSAVPASSITIPTIKCWVNY